MNKSEIVSAIAEKASMTKADAEKALNAFTETVESQLVAGESVQVVGFGTFQSTTRAAREGRNPQTGEAVQIPEKRTPTFKAGKSLKDAVNT